MKVEVTYRGGSGAQGKMEVVVECGGEGEIAMQYLQTAGLEDVVFYFKNCSRCNGSGREVRV